MNINKINKILIFILTLVFVIAGINYADQNTTWSLLSFILAMMSLGILVLIEIKIVLEERG